MSAALQPAAQEIGNGVLMSPQRSILSYIICATPRTGSYLLCEALQNTGVAGRPTEYLAPFYEKYWAPRWETEGSFPAYLDKIKETGTGANGVFGLKVHLHQFRAFLIRIGHSEQDSLEQAAPLVSDIFPNLRYVLLTRRDRVRQAVSWVRARQTQVWWETERPPAPCPMPQPDRLRFDFTAIDATVSRLDREEAIWRDFIRHSQVEHLELAYEDLCRDTFAAAGRVLEFLGLRMPCDRKPGPPKLKKQADAISEEWVARYQKLRRAKVQGNFAAFRDMHRGESIVVCGLGKSLNEFERPEQFITIGVNDIARKFSPNYLLVVDKRKRFSDERWEHIAHSEANCLFTTSDLPVTRPFLVRFLLRKSDQPVWDNPLGLHFLSRPWYSSYVATVLAAYMGARRIGLIGVDFTDDHFWQPTGPYPGAKHLPLVENHSRRLNDCLIRKGIKVFNLSSISAIRAFPRLTRDDFVSGLGLCDSLGDARAPLRIACYSIKNLDGAQSILARCINAFTPHYARAVVVEPGSDDLDFGEAAVASEDELKRADVIIAFNGRVEARHAEFVRGKPVITLAYGSDMEVDRKYVSRGYPAAVLVDGSTMNTIPGWARLPLPVPVWPGTIAPTTRRGPLRIVCSYGNAMSHECASRLRTLVSRHGIVVDHAGERGKNRCECPDVLVDDYWDGTVGRRSLQALATGSLVVNRFGRSPQSYRDIRACVPGNEKWPFQPATPATLAALLETLVKRGAESVRNEAGAAQEWMRRNWNFQLQWRDQWLPLISQALETAIRLKPKIALRQDREHQYE
jgi:LPS sulfotransferase NodH